jgi:rare lipoprotein A
MLVGLMLVCEAVSAESGKATYYSAKSCKAEGTSGVYTASGERFDEQALTCALPRRGFGGQYRVTNKANGKSVVCRHNDFGPGRGPRARGVVIDLSPAAYDALGGRRGVNKKGVAWGEITVEVEAL